MCSVTRRTVVAMTGFAERHHESLNGTRPRPMDAVELHRVSAGPGVVGRLADPCAAIGEVLRSRVSTDHIGETGERNRMIVCRGDPNAQVSRTCTIRLTIEG